MLRMIFWLLIGLLFFWLLLDYVSKIVGILWEILVPIIDSKPVDLRTKFGEWAGNTRADILGIREIF